MTVTPPPRRTTHALLKGARAPCGNGVTARGGDRWVIDRRHGSA